IHRGSVHQQRFGFNRRKLVRHLPEHAIPKHHAEALCVGLGDRSHTAFLVAALAQLKRKPDDALAAVTGEDRRLDRHFLWLMMVHETAYLRVLSLSVFPYYHH